MEKACLVQQHTFGHSDPVHVGDNSDEMSGVAVSNEIHS